MQLTSLVTTPAAAVDHDPGQPTLPGMDPDVVARAGYYNDAPNSLVKIRHDRPVDAPTFASFDEALRGASEILVADRREARWGLFKRNPGKVYAIALLEAKDGVRLVRTSVALDRFKEPVPGQMFPGQNWWGANPKRLVRETPSVLALVGAETLADLRGGGIVEPAPYAPASR